MSTAQPKLSENIAIPIHLDAYALSPKCCEGPSKLAPYTQPNYVALQLRDNVIQHDILDHIDFHLSSASPERNRRLADVGSSKGASIKLSRLGVHLHWTIPRFYRTATSTAPQPGDVKAKPDGQSATVDNSQPVFPLIPNRWLIIRHMQRCQPPGVLPAFQGWIIESDVRRTISGDKIPANTDLESDAMPFVSYAGSPGDTAALRNQCEIFLGQKFDLGGWSEDKNSRDHMKLTVMNSSNPLFPDYALHNTNVLSMIDNFKYRNAQGVEQYCTSALAHYYVLGWHDDGRDDPFSNIANLEQKLSSLMLTVDPRDAIVQSHLKLSGSVRSISHGAIYNVPYDRSAKPPSKADETATKFTQNDDMEPLAIGTTTLDATITFLKAHRNNQSSVFDVQEATDIANDIIQISSLLYATADGYDARVQALDLIAQQNYTKSDGGGSWIFGQQASPGEAPVIPSKPMGDILRTLNANQMQLDACERKLRSSQWNLFAEWWKWVSRSFLNEAAKLSAVPDVRARVDQLKQDCKDLSTAIVSLRSKIKTTVDQYKPKKTSSNFFHQRLDPTLCIAGVDSGRPKDFMDSLMVREDHQLEKNTGQLDSVFKDGSGKPINLPFSATDPLRETARRLLTECLIKSNTQETLAKTTGFRTWGTHNPFVPLFVEWEGLYYHIDNDKHNAWDVDFRPSQISPLSSQLRYEPAQFLSNDVQNTQDKRIVSGRILVMPQPSFSLEAIVRQVLAGRDPDMSLSSAQTERLLNNVRAMQFISAPLSGLTNHLLTRCDGAHVKPNVRGQGQTIVPLQAAIEAASRVGFDRDAFLAIDGESALTPYGTLSDFATAKYPFKPVTQGQMIFTKINIVDKFGQAICVPTPKPRLRKPPPDASAKIYPCLSDYFTPDVWGNKLNTVIDISGASVGTGNPGDIKGSGKYPLCQFMQLTPSINQDARINTSFVVPDEDGTKLCPWRAATDYEQPIWGWIVINYADYGLQFFLSTGEFYQEIRMGSPTGTSTSVKYVPFNPPTASSGKPTPANVQLDGLISLFKNDPDYLRAFSDMINGGIATMPYPPGDYGGFANAIVGKPLALVNVGYSLELATPAIVAQNSLGPSKAREGDYAKHPEDPEPAFQNDLEKYSFPVKIGDQQRTFDGVLGYFDTSNSLNDNGVTDWRQLYTYFPPEKPHAKFKPIDKTTFPTVRPYYIHPDPSRLKVDMPKAVAQRWTIKSLLVDPYTPLHIYSPILPSVSLQLPAWTVQSALKKMHAFFRLGPMLMTSDVPASAFLPQNQPPTATTTTVTGPSSSTTTPKPPTAINLPPIPVTDPGALMPVPLEPPTIRLPLAGRKGTWSWLQPYDVQDGGDNPAYGTWNVENDHAALKYAPAPYTFIEGFLQLAGDLERDAGQAKT